MTSQNLRPITLTLSKRHVEMMVKTHRLKEAEINDVPKVAQICAADLRRGSGSSQGLLACMGRLGESARMIAIT